MDLEQVVQRILTTRHDLSREDVLKKIYEKKHSAGGYFLDEVAARLVASDLGVEIQNAHEGFSGDVGVKDLVTGLNDVTVVGRIVAVYPVRTFLRSDLAEGRVARLTLADKTGKVQLVLWDDKASLIDSGKLREGDVVRVVHAYVREGLDGKSELHLGQRGDVQVSPKDITWSDYQIEQPFEKIGSLTGRSKRASVSGVVCGIYPVSEFKRKDGTAGKVRRLRLTDETGEIAVAVWNERVDELGEVSKGVQIRATDARVRAQQDGSLELHVDDASRIEKLTSQSHAIPLTTHEVTSKIRDLKEGGPFTLEATVATTPNVREVTTAHKERILIASFDLEDDTGKIRTTLWRNQVELARRVTIGTRIKIRNAYAKKGFSNLLELASRESTTIEVVSNPSIIG